MATCYSNQLDFTLKQQSPAVLLLWGDDAGAIRQAAQAAMVWWGVPADDPFAAEKIDIATLHEHPNHLPESATTISLMGGKRLIHLTGISGDEKAEVMKTLTEAVETTLSFPLQDVLVVLPVPRALEKKSALVKALETASNALAVRFYIPTARDMGEWLQNEFKTAQKRVEPEAMQLLTDHLGADKEQSKREVEKLLLYVGAAETVTADDVRASLSGAIPADVFRLSEAIQTRNVKHTDRLIQVLLEEGEDLNAAFSIALGDLNKLKAAQGLKAEGKDDAALLQAGGKFKAPKPAQAAYLAAIKAYPPARLAGLPTYALETLAQARSGTLDGNLVLARALLALAI
ncbi:MAG: DNA polymerase III subunit delta [Alphaproteobacteria bacterium]